MQVFTGKVSLFATLLLLLVTAQAAAPDGPVYDNDVALAQSQAAIGATLADHSFRHTDGQRFDLSQLRGKPLVISMIYTSCHHICPRITRNLQDTVDIAQEALGDDSFVVISVGFDWRIDTPDRMRLYGKQFGIDDDNWYFLSGDEIAVNALAGNLGFQFYASPKGFDHLSQTTIVDAEGVVYRQIYGENFGPPALVEPLKELVFDIPRSAGVIEHWLGTFKLFCTVYDPNTGRYAFDYSIFLGIFIGVLCLGSIAAFVAREWKHAR